jgi:hypothetical protein
MDKVKVFVDLDDTLIDTSLLKEKLFAKISQMGVPREKIREGYENSKDENGVPILDEWVKSYSEVDPQRLRAELENIYREVGREGFYRGRMNWLLEKYPPETHRLILITKGEDEVQRWKMEGIDLKLFADCRVVREGKAEALQNQNLVNTGEYFIMVDNQEGERMAVGEAFPQSEMISPEKIDEELRREQKEQGEPSRREG